MINLFISRLISNLSSSVSDLSDLVVLICVSVFMTTCLQEIAPGGIKNLVGFERSKRIRAIDV